MYVQSDNQVRSRNQYCHSNATISTHSERVFVALVTQHAHACAILKSVARLALPHFSTVQHKLHDFPREGEGGDLLSMKACFDFLCSFREKKKL